MRERARTDISIENFSRSRFERRKRVGSAVKLFFDLSFLTKYPTFDS